MKIKLSPVRLDDRLDAAVSGNVITINGELFDFSQLNDGESLPSSAIESTWIIGSVANIGGEIHLTLVLPHGANAPHETRFPAAFAEPMTVHSGPVPLPPYDVEDFA